MSDSTIEPIARSEGETLADYIPRLGGTVLEFQPGSRWAYSPGAGFETLGRVLEIVSGHTARRILRAAHLRAARHARHHVLADRRRMAARRDHLSTRGATVSSKVVSPNDTLSRDVYFRGSGGLFSTAESYVPFGIMLANGGELGGVRLLSPQVRRDARRRARARHAAGPAGRRRLRLERARRHRSRRARHAVVRRHLRLVRRARHALLRRSRRNSSSAC